MFLVPITLLLVEWDRQANLKIQREAIIVIWNSSVVV